MRRGFRNPVDLDSFPERLEAGRPGPPRQEHLATGEARELFADADSERQSDLTLDEVTVVCCESKEFAVTRASVLALLNEAQRGPIGKKPCTQPSRITPQRGAA